MADGDTPAPVDLDGMTISQFIKEMLDEGLVTEKGLAEARAVVRSWLYPVSAKD